MTESSDGCYTISDFITSHNIDSNLNIHDTFHILHFMTDISKNIYNSVIFCNTIFYKFKKYIFHNTICFFSRKKKFTRDNVFEKIIEQYDYYYNLFISSKNIIHTNNEIIYPFVKNYIQGKIIVNDNYHSIRNYLINTIEKNNKFSFKSDLDRNYHFIDIIDNIIRPIYIRNWNTTKNQLICKIPCVIQDPRFIEQIKQNQFLFGDDSVSNGTDEKNDFNKLMEKKKIEMTGFSDQNIISRFVYRHLGDNYNSLPGDVITEIINKSFTGYKSYYSLKEKGIKCNLPKYLDKTSKYNLIFSKKSFKIEGDYARLTIGKHVANNFNKITKNNSYQILNKNDETEYKKYVNSKFLNTVKIIKTEKVKKVKKNGKICEIVEITEKEERIKKSENFIVNKRYISRDNERIVNGYYLKIKLPLKLKNKVIRQIEIKPVYNGHSYKIYFNYADNRSAQIIDKLTTDNTISVDLGITNMMTIYNPNGKAKIIKGGHIINLNRKYNKEIDKAKSDVKKINDTSKTTKRIKNMLINRENKINAYFDNIVAWVNKNYKDKNIIIGYNEGWKTEANMGRETNRKFYGIPYAKLINKLKMKLGNKLIKTEESYTSMCDALALEKIGKNENYKGKRVKRGLYQSSTGKLINADINGAINIMRKKINMKEVKGAIMNPEIVTFEKGPLVNVLTNVVMVSH